ncbi:hypothetical protein DAH36_25025, partial [Escherichia coli]|uniref:hypothetical protein n=1 Tax=Escherichia coli TaxID=562 RepID=UPI00110516F1
HGGRGERAAGGQRRKGETRDQERGRTAGHHEREKGGRAGRRKKEEKGGIVVRKERVGIRNIGRREDER